MCFVCRNDGAAMAGLVIGSLQFPAEMLLGPLGTAVGFVLDLVVDQIKLWDNNKCEASILQQLLVQTRGHMQLLRDLAAQLASKQDRADISKVLGTFCTPRYVGSHTECSTSDALQLFTILASSFVHKHSYSSKVTHKSPGAL